MAIRVLLQSVKPTMRLAHPILDVEGHLVAGAGTQLREGVVRALRKLALQSVLVTDAGEVPSWDTVRPVAEELADLEERLPAAARVGALADLHAAIVRHLTVRAARVSGPSEDAGDDGAAPGGRP